MVILVGLPVGSPTARGQIPTPTPAPTPTPSPTATPTPTPAPASPRGTPSPAPAPTPAQRIVGIEVVGNRNIPLEQIMAVITLRPGQTFDPERLRADAEAIVALGWFADVSARVETEAAGVRVIFVLVENPVVVAVVVEGNTVIPSEDILKALDVPLGQVLNSRRLRDGARAVEDLYEKKGYVLARVIDVSLEPAGDGRLRVRVAEGRVEEVVFKGLAKTRPATARRYVRLKTGDIFNVQQMNADLQRLFATQLFETVQARPRPGSTPDTVIIEIEVKEARTSQIGFGLGYSSASGFIGQVEYTDRNWRGKAQTFSLRAERGITRGASGATRFTYTMSFVDPYLDARQTSLNINLFQTATAETEIVGASVTSKFDLERVGSFIELGRPLDTNTAISLRLRSERADITPLPLVPGESCTDDPPPDPDCPAPTAFSPGRTVSLLLAGTRDTRDNRFNATRGTRQQLSLEFALPTLGGDFSFQKYFAEWVQYVPLRGDVRLVGRVSAGYGNGFIPLQERYILGGPTTLRGYPPARFRGTSMVLANLEVRAPLGGIAAFLKEFTGVLFVDAGQTWPAVPTGTAGLKVTYGVGVAFTSPIGVLRVDVAWGPQGSQTWLNLGHPF